MWTACKPIPKLTSACPNILSHGGISLTSRSARVLVGADKTIQWTVANLAALVGATRDVIAGRHFDTFPDRLREQLVEVIRLRRRISSQPIRVALDTFRKKQEQSFDMDDALRDYLAKTTAFDSYILTVPDDRR